VRTGRLVPQLHPRGFASAEVEGLVTNPPAKAPTVTVVDRATAPSIRQVRSALERFAVRLFVRHATQAHEAALSVSLKRLAVAHASGILSQTLPAENAFYEARLDGADHPVIADMLRTLNSRVSQLRGASLSRVSGYGTPSMAGRLNPIANHARSNFSINFPE
jgi:DNA-binding GntR family transcriptional regulator